jgi:hypothetical protein
MDIQKSFSYPFEDRQGLSKLGLGALISLVPILGLAWSGYMVEIIRNVMAGSGDPLPTWDDLGRKFTDGLILFAAGLIYALPLLLLVGVPVSMMVFSGILSGSSDLRSLSEPIAGLSGVLFAALSCVFVLYALALSVLYPAILVAFARRGTFASCFNLAEITGMISRASGPFLTAWGMSVVAGLLVGAVVSIVTAAIGWIPCIGWAAALVLTLATGVYTTAIHAHLFGQFGAMADQASLALAAAA